LGNVKTQVLGNTPIVVLFLRLGEKSFHRNCMEFG
jgi:hypothetical protein